MNRRKAIQNIAMMISAAVLLPQGLVAENEHKIEINNLDIDPVGIALLSEVCETIIPKSDTPGSKDLKLHLFVIKMVDDCYKEKDQQYFMAGLNQLNDLSRASFGSSFKQATLKQRESLLTSLETREDYSNELKAFYKILKSNTLLGYTQSKFFMTKQVFYELIPARYNSHFPVKTK